MIFEGLFARCTPPLVAEHMAADTLGAGKVERQTRVSNTLMTILDGLIERFVSMRGDKERRLTAAVARARHEWRQKWLQLVGALGERAHTIADGIVPVAADFDYDLADGECCHVCGEQLQGTIVRCRESRAHRACAVNHCAAILGRVYDDRVLLCPCGCQANMFTDLSASACP